MGNWGCFQSFEMPEAGAWGELWEETGTCPGAIRWGDMVHWGQHWTWQAALLCRDLGNGS